MHPKLRIAKEFDDLQAQVFRLEAEVEAWKKTAGLMAQEICRHAEEMPPHIGTIEVPTAENVLNFYHAKAQAEGK